MSKNNPVGIIPIKTPILKRLKIAINEAFSELTEEELKALEKEIDAVTDNNCDWQIKDIADMYAHQVKQALHGIF